MDNFRKWLIRKLGGHVSDNPEWCSFKSDYYTEEHVNTRIYVPSNHFTDAAKPDIERELATKIGLELLNRGLLWYDMSRTADKHGNVFVDCRINVLKLKDPQPYHAPSRLVDKERRRHDE